ncbi:hypothetical protein FBZ83_12633 [Azospirillum brasilense]|uniref:Uncharacterized protein n=1 Tax=Azospirillum brasilense TaxID=192 RepID=A0A560BMY6_AZOBR|nr:hypothetical protein FBZ83_12633 [Azospirillum brasilense]
MSEPPASAPLLDLLALVLIWGLAVAALIAFGD